MKKIHLLILVVLSVGMFIVSCSSDDNGTTQPTPTAKPTISSIMPNSGPVGTQVTINGTNFSATAASNTVKIGATTATVSAATATKLTISVPQGASTGAVSVAVGGQTVTGNTFTVTEAEVQNTAPVITNQTTTAEVPEDADNTFDIFTVTATDVDADDTLVFEITDGNGEGLFSVDENGLITLADGKNLDFEIATEHNITVTVSDGNGGTDEITVQIAVQNVIEDLFEDPASFIFTLETVDTNEEFDMEIYGEDGDVDFQIDWGDGQPEENVIAQGGLSHDYIAPGTYTVALKGKVDRITFIGQAALQTVEQWGTTEWKSMEDMFYLGNNNIIALNAKDKPNLDQCISLKQAFINVDFKQDIGGWDVGQITNMEATFISNHGFNQDISSWDVSNVETMRSMFYDATAFDQDISGWDVGQVTNMQFMFYEAESFDQPIGDWDVGNVQTMIGMFQDATAFDQDISSWDVGQVTTMEFMFYEAESFNQPIGDWNVSKVQTMYAMFAYASNFNQNLGSWEIGNVVTMAGILSDSGMSATNFSDTLIGWSQQDVQLNVPLGAHEVDLCIGDGVNAYDALTDIDNWNIVYGDDVPCN
ncbi:MAG: BspA family leucine-rich repeat surface protein [Bacteroidota bacterium]